MLRPLLSAALAALAPLPAAAQSAIHSTGSVRLEVFNNGAIGARAGQGLGFSYMGSPSLLFDSRLMVGVAPDRVSGQAFSDADWVTFMGPTSYSGSFQEYRSGFNDAASPNPLGIEVVQTSRSTNDPSFRNLVLLFYTVANNSSTQPDGVYVGLFADFDVGPQDLGGIDTPRVLVYTYAPNQPLPYVGIALFEGLFSGWSVSLPGSVTDARIFEGMTTQGVTPTAPGDRVTVVGSGPYSIPPGGSVNVSYAIAAGSSLAGLRAATAGLPVGADGSPDDGLALSAAVAPNPATAHTALSFTLTEARDVRLFVTDVLGREVIAAGDRRLGAGTHIVPLDVRELAAGLYIAHVTSGDMSASSRFTVVR